jgi:hypothetical protein
MNKPTLIIGDVHGHLDRFEALLKQEGIIGPCPDCDGFGDIPTGQCGDPHDPDNDTPTADMCPYCKGDGQRRINFNVDVVQLGDLGHFGEDASPTGDELCYKYALDWIDVVLWGNHDRAIVDGACQFKGYLKPRPTVIHYLKQLANSDRLKFAHTAHGHLITHAGLHARFKYQNVDIDKNDPNAVADWINENDGALWGWENVYPEANAVINAVGRKRNGRAPVGGILWRDRNEKLFDEFPQVFGHSADWEGRILRFNHRQIVPKGKHWCVDIGCKDFPRLGGVWIDENGVRPVRVDL